MENVKPGIYKHFKGKFSLVTCVAKHSDDGSELVIYRGLNDGGFFARPYESFIEMVDDKQGNKVPRFTPATELEISELLNQNLIDAQTVSELEEMTK